MKNSPNLFCLQCSYTADSASVFLCVFNQRGETETREFLHTLAEAVPTPSSLAQDRCEPPVDCEPPPPLTQEHTVHIYINQALLV